MTDSNQTSGTYTSPASPFNGMDTVLVGLAKKRTKTLIRGHLRLEDMLALAFIRGVHVVAESNRMTKAKGEG